VLLFEAEVRITFRVLAQELLPLWQVYTHVSAPVGSWGLPRLMASKQQAEQGLRLICAHQGL